MNNMSTNDLIADLRPHFIRALRRNKIQDAVRLIVVCPDFLTLPLNHAQDQALHIAAGAGQRDMVHFLLSYAAVKSNLETKNARGETPLLSAVMHPRVCQILTVNGARTDVCDGLGQTYEMRQLIVERATQPDKRSNHYSLEREVEVALFALESRRPLSPHGASGFARGDFVRVTKWGSRRPINGLT